MSKHTPEPWFTDDTFIGSSASDQLNSGYFTADCIGPDASANARRIATCVNACVGMADPATEIVELKRQRDELLGAISNIAAVVHCGGVCGLSSDDALVLIRKVTLKHWDRNSDPQHVMGTITRVSNQTKGI